MADHNAVDSSLGYAQQALRALILLLRADDDASVSLEKVDDIGLHAGEGETLLTIEQTQVAHTLKENPPELTIKSEKLWKTLGIWLDTFDPKIRYVFLTSNPLGSDLACLRDDTPRDLLLDALEKEAKRVDEAYKANESAYKSRIKQCQAFLAATSDKRTALLNAIHASDASPNILATDSILNDLLKNTLEPTKRPLLITRLREFWVNRVIKALSKHMSAYISKAELQTVIADYIQSLTGSLLPDDFGSASPPGDLSVPDTMRQQIELVNGGNYRISRAKVVRWRSRNQRNRWMDEKITFGTYLDEFDIRLLAAWGDQHGPMVDDCANSTSQVKCERGLQLLEWSHNNFPVALCNVGKKVAPQYLAQGTFQDMANRRLLGWHPQYTELLPKEDPDAKPE